MHPAWKCHLSHRCISSVLRKTYKTGQLCNYTTLIASKTLRKFTCSSLFSLLVHNTQNCIPFIHLQSRSISISSRFHLPKANASEVTSILEEKILKNTPNLDLSSTGKVLSVGDGIARIYGLKDVQAEEMVTFSSGIQVYFMHI